MLTGVSRRHEAGGDDANTLTAYLREIAKLPRVTVDEERALGQRIRDDGDEAAVTRLVEANLRFVVSYAKRYRYLGVSFLDLIHQGNLGLIEAAHRFDPSRNVKFITYAVWWVRESMTHVLADQTRAFSFPPKLFSAMYRVPGGGADVSLSDPVGGGRAGRQDAPSRALGDVLLEDGVTPIEEKMIRQADLDELTAALGDLNCKEREVVRLRFGLGDDQPRTLQEVGDRLSLSRERVRQIESSAKEKLRRSARLRSHLN
jgi:RNA polymerase primary sigma factor